MLRRRHPVWGIMWPLKDVCGLPVHWIISCRRLPIYTTAAVGNDSADDTAWVR